MKMDLSLLSSPPEWRANNERSCNLRLTAKAKRILAFVETYEAQHGTGPEMPEVHHAIVAKNSRGHGYGGTVIVLNRLVDCGYLKFHYRRYRIIRAWR